MGAHDAHSAAANIDLPYPVQVDLVQERSGWTYLQSQTELPLYMSVADPLGRSMCNDGCAKRWLPLIAPSDAKPLGEWTIIDRNDGRRQWAFEGHAVYTYVKDTPQEGDRGGGYLVFDAAFPFGIASPYCLAPGVRLIAALLPLRA